jgi:hypothetical protein
VTKALIDFRGLEGLATYFKRFPETAEKAARLAINDAADKAVTLARRAIIEQVAFKPSYLDSTRLGVKQRARGADLEAVISARDRATSLARFALGTVAFGRPKRPPRVRVKQGGGATSFKRGFFVKLKRGNALTEDSFNIGLAVRLKKGESLAGSQAAAKLGGGVYLLYGPSVAQVFNTVRDDIAPEVAEFAAFEFHRQFRRLSGD